MTSKFCTNCGAPRVSGTRFCIDCGEPLDDAHDDAHQLAREAPEATGATDSPNAPSHKAVYGLLGAALLVVVGAVGLILLSSDESSSQTAAPSSRATQSPTSATRPTHSPSQGSAPSLAVTPNEALALGAAEARSQLRKQRNASLDALDALAYEWVPQVSSKCEGLDNVDLKPAWFPDGRPDTSNLTPQKILAFHLALAERDSALLVTNKDVGDRLEYSACGGNTMWTAVADHGFASAAGANAWCDRNGYPYGECAARLVVLNGESGSRVVWRE